MTQTVDGRRLKVSSLGVEEMGCSRSGRGHEYAPVVDRFLSFGSFLVAFRSSGVLYIDSLASGVLKPSPFFWCCAAKECASVIFWRSSSMDWILFSSWLR